MHQTIHEKVEVIGVYQHSKFKPVKFKWQQRIFRVEHINLVSDFKEGGQHYRLYSVEVEGDLYRLQFNREDETWWLEQVWLKD